jgi:hypothetical protein
MSDTFAGLTRRINAFVHDRETSEELSHLIDESKDTGGDAADALIELALGDEFIKEDFTGDDESAELDVALEDDELADDDDDLGDDLGDEVATTIDAALDEIGDGLDDDDDEGLGEAAQLRLGEVLVI